MNTTVKRRSLDKVVKKAPQQLWNKHRENFEKNSRGGGSSSISHQELSDRSASEFTKAKQARSFSTSKYSIYPVRSSGVLPLFAPTTNNHNSKNVFSFDYQATGFVWNLYKPPFFQMMMMSMTNNSNNNNAISSHPSATVESFIEETFNKSEKEFQNMLVSSSSSSSKDGNHHQLCPFQTAARLEMNKLRQALEWNPEKNNRFVNFSNSKNGSSDENIFGDKENDEDSGEESLLTDEFDRKNRSQLSRAEALSGLGLSGEQEKLRSKNLLKAAAAAEIPHPLAFAWAAKKKWNYEFGTILSKDISGVVPVVIKEDTSSSSSSNSSSTPAFSDMITHATFEAVVEGHIPRSLPSARLEALLSETQDAPSIFTRMMQNNNKEIFENSSSSSLKNSSSTPRPDIVKELEEVEVSQVAVARHGYYLQEPVTVVRWTLNGRNCARVSPDEVLKKIFYLPPSPSEQKRNTSNNKLVSSSSSANILRGSQQVVVGHPSSLMTQRYDIPIPMCCLRGVKVGDPNSDSNNNSSKSVRIFALPRSPYASEEMIASSPNASRYADAVRKANLMDGYWTP